jgi:hypothetical protein
MIDAATCNAVGEYGCSHGRTVVVGANPEVKVQKGDSR